MCAITARVAVKASGESSPRLRHGVLFDLLMAVMNSLAVWTTAAGNERQAFAWRDAVTRKIVTASRYVPYEEQVVAAAVDRGLPPKAASELFERWRGMEPWPDTAAISRLRLPYGFVTNSSKRLARLTAARARLAPRFVLSAEEAGWYKPDPRIYLEACRRLGSPPASTLFVAGSAYDAEGARAAGLNAVLVARRCDQRARDSEIPVAASLHEVVAGLERGP